MQTQIQGEHDLFGINHRNNEEISPKSDHMIRQRDKKGKEILLRTCREICLEQ